MKSSRIWAFLVLAAALLLAACSAEEANTAQVKSDQAEQTEKVVIENEGFVNEYKEAPKRAISLNQHVTEIMLALGLEDSMAGTAFLDNEIYEPLQEAYDKVPVLAEQYPSKEQVISSEADFLYGGWDSAFNEKNIATREELKELGINSYLQSSSVKVAPTLEDVYSDIRNIAKIFRVEERGEKLINQMNQEIEAITSQLPEVKEPLDVLVYDSGETDVFTATQNFMNTLVTMAGGRNVFGDVKGNWATVSKEDAVERQPDVIVVIDYGSTTAQQKIEFLKKDPALSQTPAVQNERFVILPLSAASEGVRVGEALEVLAKGFYPEAF
ncbi:ABC transporter substrate-binding protein [Cytobacillus firmus]|uniref:ABC transporter substrate-binding protein n=1 Tax=Cytobacillus firmus TaxID=1399 RepID=UPI0018CF88E2|nr:ABC transporter substrate-binding protein [Cytobacillus firmus]MBG9654971.1 iron ABC transporter substrate-binding protein [Cytobacillus firmus]MED1907698.1 ABC transporter substrate-binding protein [Cytobacillus firmus]